MLVRDSFLVLGTNDAGPPVFSNTHVICGGDKEYTARRHKNSKGAGPNQRLRDRKTPLPAPPRNISGRRGSPPDGSGEGTADTG